MGFNWEFKELKMIVMMMMMITLDDDDDDDDNNNVFVICADIHAMTAGDTDTPFFVLNKTGIRKK